MVKNIEKRAFFGQKSQSLTVPCSPCVPSVVCNRSSAFSGVELPLGAQGRSPIFRSATAGQTLTLSSHTPTPLPSLALASE